MKKTHNTQKTRSSALWSSDQVMTKLNYHDKSAFWLFVHSSGLPHLRLNSRRILFDPRAVEAWLKKRAIGTHDECIMCDESAYPTDGGSKR